MAARRGQCDMCRYRLRLRKDGTLQVHYLYSGSQRHDEPCGGSGEPPRPLRFDEHGRPDCGDCLAYLYGHHGAYLAEGTASVAIEAGGDPVRMLRNYLGAFHQRDHAEAA